MRRLTFKGWTGVLAVVAILITSALELHRYGHPVHAALWFVVAAVGGWLVWWVADWFDRRLPRPYRSWVPPAMLLIVVALVGCSKPLPVTHTLTIKADRCSTPYHGSAIGMGMWKVTVKDASGSVVASAQLITPADLGWAASGPLAPPSTTVRVPESSVYAVEIQGKSASFSQSQLYSDGWVATVAACY